MSWTDKEIDELYKQQVAEKEFVYKDEYWKEMEALLPQKQRGDFWWLFTAFGFMGLIAVSPFWQTDVSTNSGRAAWSKQGSRTISVSNNRVQYTFDDLSTMEGSVGHSTGTVKEKTTPNVSMKTGSKSNLMSSFEKTSSSTHSARSTETESVEPMTRASNSGAEIHVGGELLTENTTLSIESKVSTIAESALEVNTLSTLTVQRIENSGSLEIQPIYDWSLPLTRPQWYVQGVLGGAQSPIIPSTTNSYNYGLGIGIEMYKGRFVFNTGVNAIVGNYKDIQLNRQAKLYGFGSEVYNYQLNYDQLYFLEANLSMGYTLGNHQLSLGVRPSFVMSSKVRYQLDDGDGATREVVYGHMEGVNRFGIRPSIGYLFKWNKGFAIGLNIGTELLPVLNESNINGVNKRYPVDGQLFIRKTISFRNQ